MVSENTEPLRFIALAGPTASGKTALSVALAKLLDTEIINADSMQIWRGLDIGTAKVTEEETDGIPHHLFDIVDPGESFTVQQYKEAAERCIRTLNASHKVPIVVGGTGLYFQALVSDLDFGQASPRPEDRARRLAEKSAEQLHELLRQKNPARADEIDPRNVRRVLRALEIEEQSDAVPAQNDWRATRKDAVFSFYCLRMERSLLWERIEKRAERMLEQGLLEECRPLLRMPREAQACRGIGYAEGLDHWRGLSTWDELRNSIVIHTRQYAKRQMTWFRKMEQVRWIDTDGQGTVPDIRRITEEITNAFEYN